VPPDTRQRSVGAAPVDASPSPEAGVAWQFARNSGFGSIAGLCTALGSFLTTVIVAHLLGVQSTGLMAYALWVASVAASVADLGVSAALARFLPEFCGVGRWREAEGIAAYLFRPLAGASALVLSGFVLYAGSQWQMDADNVEPALWLMIGCTTALLTLTGFCYGRIRGMQRFDRLALLAIVSLMMQLAGVALGSIVGGVVGAMVGCCAGLVPPAAYGAFSLPRSRPVSGELRRRVNVYALYAWGGGLVSVFVWSRIEVFFLQHAKGAEAVGLFSVSLTLSSLATQGPILLTAGLLPYFATSFGRGALDEMREAYATAARVLAFLVCPACFGMAAIMPVALPLIYGRAFAGAVPAAIILLVAAGIAALSSVGSSLIFAMERSDFIFVSGLVAAALSVLAGITVVQSFGLMGAVWGRAGVQFIAVALSCWFVVRRLRCPIPFRDLARIVTAAALCGAAARGTLLLPLGAASLPAAIATGVAVYLVLSRLLRVLPPQDVERLRSLNRALPVRLHGPAERMLCLVFEHRHGMRPIAGQAKAMQESPR
jgi:O-antigen/teichoic acid export membrane protein